MTIEDTAAANRGMFVGEKTINGYTYLYLVESVRADGRSKQRIIKNLGRKDAVLASGGLERLAASVARYAERALVLSQIDGGTADGVVCRRIGPPLLFGRLWEETGCRAVIAALLAGRADPAQVLKTMAVSSIIPPSEHAIIEARKAAFMGLYRLHNHSYA